MEKVSTSHTQYISTHLQFDIQTKSKSRNKLGLRNDSCEIIYFVYRLDTQGTKYFFKRREK